jgi:hypothetical protein
MMRHPEIAKPRQEGTELGMFAVSAELLMVAVLLAVGVHFVLTPTEPDIVAWFAFGLIVLFLFDVVRRIMNIAKGRAPA